MRERVHEQLRDLTGPIAVIGHSLGSIVGYDTLNSLTDGFEGVRLYLTVGSPLGIREIQDQLVKPQRVPPVVERWLNLADPLDVVALDKRLKGEFAPDSKVSDESVDNWTNNNHSIDGYLDKPIAKDAVEDALKRTD